MLDIAESIALSTVSKVIKKFLSSSEKNILIHKQIIINGFLNQIYFCSEVITGRRNRVTAKFEAKYHKIFNKNHNYIFSKDYNIKIRTELNEDVSREIIEFKAQKKVLPIYKFTEVKGTHFTIDAEGPFKEDYRDLYHHTMEKEPRILDEGKQMYYRTYLVFHSKRYPCQEIQYIQIPITVNFPLLFFIPDVFNKKYIRLLDLVKKRRNIGRKLERYKSTMKQIYNVDIDKFENAVLFLYEKLSVYLENNFRQHFSINSELDAMLHSIRIRFQSVFEGVPKPTIEAIITVNYTSKDRNMFNFDLYLNKDKFVRKSKRLWKNVLENLPSYLD